MIKPTTTTSFADTLISHKKVNFEFFDRINKMVDFNKISKEIKKHYHKGESVDGRKSYDGLLLFKMLMLQYWFGLSDEQVELQVNDRISFSRFCGLSIDADVPDATVLCRFRTALSKKNAFEKLLVIINNQLEKNQVILKKGVVVDASITDTDFKPKGKKIYEVVEDRNEDESQPVTTKLEEKIKPGVDTEAAWLKKRNKLHYGYKKHIATNEDGYVLGVHTTAANESDTKNFKPLLNKIDIPQHTPVLADKGYRSEENKNYIESRKLKSRIQHKASRNHPLSDRAIAVNKAISKVRYVVERTFGSIRRWFKSTKARYKGLAKTHSQHLLEAICYNLYRQPKVG